MSVSMCETTRERIPDHVRGELAAAEAAELEAHVGQCTACAAELDLAGALFATRPAPPAELVGRIQQAVRYDRRAVQRPWWGLTAAAVAALALGIGFANADPSNPALEVPTFAYEVENSEGMWLADDGLVAGAPSFEDLSDEALAELLEELSVGSSGGAA